MLFFYFFVNGNEYVISWCWVMLVCNGGRWLSGGIRLVCLGWYVWWFCWNFCWWVSWLVFVVCWWDWGWCFWVFLFCFVWFICLCFLGMVYSCLYSDWGWWNFVCGCVCVGLFLLVLVFDYGWLIVFCCCRLCCCNVWWFCRWVCVYGCLVMVILYWILCC